MKIVSTYFDYDDSYHINGWTIKFSGVTLRKRVGNYPVGDRFDYAYLNLDKLTLSFMNRDAELDADILVAKFKLTIADITFKQIG